MIYRELGTTGLRVSCSIWKNGQYLRTRNLDEVKAGFEESLRLLQTDCIDVSEVTKFMNLVKAREEMPETVSGKGVAA